LVLPKLVDKPVAAVFIRLLATIIRLNGWNGNTVASTEVKRILKSWRRRQRLKQWVY
jgi:hypothetical protein